jgi:hypothetical protein
MQNPDIKDSDKFKAVASQEEARLGYLHPTLEGIPACMTAFDDFLSCNSMPTVLSSLLVPGILTQLKSVLGTQLKSIYRFGEMAHCSAKWNEFKFCMSVKGLHPEQWRDAWILRRAECWARPRLGLSSENVWEMRAYVMCLITTTNMSVLSNASSEPLRELPTTFTPTRCHGGTCRMNLIFEPIYRFATLVFDLLESKWWD